MNNHLHLIAITPCPYCGANPGQECDFTYKPRKVPLEPAIVVHTERYNRMMHVFGLPEVAIESGYASTSPPIADDREGCAGDDLLEDIAQLLSHRVLKWP